MTSTDNFDLEQGRSPRKPSVKSPGSRRLSGRLPGGSSPGLKPLTPIFDDASNEKDGPPSLYPSGQIDALVEQVSKWISDERVKRSRAAATKSEQSPSASKEEDEPQFQAGDAANDLKPWVADVLNTGPDFDKLEDILKHTLNLDRLPRRKSATSLRPKSSLKKLHRKASSHSSDTEYFDSEVLVPSCDAVLDNANTMSYTGGASDESDVSSGDELTRAATHRDHSAWTKFKFEIVRLSHTLRLKGWRKVSLDMSGAITVQRLSGALTNAVYVVSPPVDLPPREDRDASGNIVPKPRKPPPKLLLRIYGPQVEHLIDREEELAILRRLARKRIGPRLLGTFANGRFEEFFHATTLTADDLRNPDTSRQIAKRMRELHDGIELLDRERDDGAFVWRNWDKWVQRVEQVVSWLDAEVANVEPGVKPTGPNAWKRRGLICGVPWARFNDMVEKYREWLDAQYGGSKRLKEKLVFAHNDTQYGNLLRMVPSGESPLLLPANTHKQLVVIDFEYANANMRGLEFANHFTEWCYNYHDKRKPYGLNASGYPTPEEQDRFVRAYVRHRPQYNISTPTMSGITPPLEALTPGVQPSRRPTSSVSDFMLDARTPYVTPSASQQASHEAAEKAAEDADVARLLHETRLWRLANTAQWVAWGIVQAKVPGMPDFSDEATGANSQAAAIEDGGREDLGERAEEYRELARMENAASEKVPEKEEDQEEEFDYLGYAQHRAMFFWGDALQMGLVKAEELPLELMEKVKSVPY
ncbi:hypothetical protein LTR36_000005 [Oleoguttula mirabilis]|uniref:Choline kinase N-terminal domain-containing protein n=1 Tax=Oleoguttula mirabilis TaxID=1507867 RepID=A0AAV9JZ43_9PEZI|nr:hypothetical protein LTR36_000005 [Oleoguttula mirabilis]